MDDMKLVLCPRHRIKLAKAVVQKFSVIDDIGDGCQTGGWLVCQTLSYSPGNEDSVETENLTVHLDQIRFQPAVGTSS